MRLHRNLRSTLLAVAVSASLLAPRLARAQLDDPGLAPPPPPPPKPAPPPPPAARPAPRPAVTPAPAPAPMPAPVAAKPAGAVPPSADAPVKEEVTEETKTIRASSDDNVWSQKLAAPSLTGAVGLFRVLTAETGAPGTFRAALHIQGFSQDGFIIKPQPDGTGGDSNQRFLGDFVLSIAGPDIKVLRNFELYFGVFNSSNQNKRVDPGKTDPPVILALADVGIGLKAAGEVVRGFSLGGNLGFRFLNSVSGVAANFDATQIDFNLLAMLDVRRLAKNVPLRFHLNVGYIVDNSLQLLPYHQDPADGQLYPQCTGPSISAAKGLGNNSCVRSRLVETFAYGINNSRVRLGFAAEAPVAIHYGDGRIFGIAPFVEYRLDVVTALGDTAMRDNLNNYVQTGFQAECGALSDPALIANCRNKWLDIQSRITGTTSQWVTIGLRLRPIAGLLIDLGVDIGIQNAGWQYGPAIPRWNVLGGLGYAYDFSGGTTKQVTRTVTRTYEVNKKAPSGKLSGTVLDVNTKKPIAGALVRYAGGLTAQATDDKGQFTSYDLPAGGVQMQISHPDYESISSDGGKGSPVVKVGETKNITVRLKPLPPKEGKVRVKVTDDKGQALPGATGRLTCPNNVNKEALFDGEQLVVAGPPGNCTVSIEANQFLGKDKAVTLTANGDQFIEVQLRKRPKKSSVEITKDAIVLKASIHFATNEATILPDGQQLLDEVVDVMSKNAQIKRVSIEGHTDNSGDATKNMKLSKDRARSVLDYLVKNGIAAERLQSEGFGQDKPLAPNTSAGGRTKNRRVEFRILDQGSAGATFLQ